ncbi:MAG TPA: DUF3089 domain-containing protein [Acidimicrobiales bacterium]|nr:DUF3089 domain-containing protein [Acidimicrobiales bacterium]
MTTLAAGACSSTGTSTGTSAGGASTTTTASATTTPPAATVWLCRPGAPVDPCTGNLSTTVVVADGSQTRQRVVPATSPSVDCFYLYPTVSPQTSMNANLKIQPAEVATAIAQAERFSQVCRVWAPIYRQETLAGLEEEGLSSNQYVQIAYESVLSAWRDYLDHDNDGRPIVFIGHSQGAAMLIDLLRTQVDPNPALRKRLVSAIILGGNVEVPTGELVGGTFQHIPACRSTQETGCVIAYSSFMGAPPADSLFARPGQGVSLQSGQTATAGLQVVCVNPAAPSGGTGALQPIFPAPRRVLAPWVEYPDLYTATCESAGGATWLNIQVVKVPGDRRPIVSDVPLGPRWGLHEYDVNLALGNLVQMVASEVASLRGA